MRSGRRRRCPVPAERAERRRRGVHPPLPKSGHGKRLRSDRGFRSCFSSRKSSSGGAERLITERRDKTAEPSELTNVPNARSPSIGTDFSRSLRPRRAFRFPSSRPTSGVSESRVPLASSAIRERSGDASRPIPVEREIDSISFDVRSGIGKDLAVVKIPSKHTRSAHVAEKGKGACDGSRTRRQTAPGAAAMVLPSDGWKCWRLCARNLSRLNRPIKTARLA